MSSSTYRSAFAVALVLLTWLFATQAWVVDDAYITFRTVDNFVNGRGLTWNPEERVQAYTHPLWMLLLSAFYFVTREAFLTVLFVSYGLLLLLIAVVHRELRRDAPWKTLLFLALLVSSKAFFDFTSSGLENPLTSVLAVVFACIWLRQRGQAPEERERRYAALVLVAALAFANRMDTILLFLPALVWETFRLGREQPARTARLAALASLPATGWLAFSLLYYGAPFPNTAYAKALRHGLDATDAWHAGAAYFLNSLEWDPPTLVLIVLALGWAVHRRQAGPLLLAAGIASYLVYVAKLGGIGTHMSGRFFSAPFVLAALLLLHMVRDRWQAMPVGVALAAFVFLSPGAPIRSQGSTTILGNKGQGRSGIIDTRYFVHREGAALLSWERGRRWPNHGWHESGLRFRRGSEKVSVGGAGGGLPIGYFSFGAGPDRFVIDVLGLTDPLLARLPMRRGFAWWPGHFRRDVPAGYVESVRAGENLLEDPDLRAYYEEIRRITRGPLLSRERFGSIVRLHTGALQPLVERYLARQAAPRREPEAVSPPVAGEPG